MVHKLLPSPTSGVETNFLYGEDWNKLIDHLEGRSKTDPFTFTVDEDIIKHSTTNVAGDILVNTGTRFNRLAIGTAGQIIGVKDDLTGLEWINPPTGGGGEGGGGVNAGGSILKSGNASTTVFLIPHGLSPIPEVWFVDAMTSDAMGNCTKTIDATNIIVTYAIPPPTGTNNLQFVWGAGYVNAATGDFTPTSTHTLTGKTLNIDANTIKHSTTNAVGDLYKSDGTKIVRHAKGTANQLLRMNSGATDIEWGTYSTIPTVINDLTDVTITSIANDQILTYDSTTSSWINETQTGITNNPALFNEITIPANQSNTDDILVYDKQIDTNNNALFAKYKEAGAIVEVRVF